VIVAVEAVVVAAVVATKALIPLVALQAILVGESRRWQGVNLGRHLGAILLPMSRRLEPKNQGKNRGSDTAGFDRQCALRHCNASYGISGRPGLAPIPAAPAWHPSSSPPPDPAPVHQSRN